MNRFLAIFGIGRLWILNAILFAVCVGLLIWIAAIWLQPMPDASIPESVLAKKKDNKGAFEKETAETNLSSYAVIVEKDVFRETRRKTTPKPVQIAKPVPPPPPPPPPPKRPPPRLTLFGTIIMADGNKAIIDYNGRRNYFGIGDNIEDFVITEIGANEVFLERDGEPLKITITNQ